MRLTLAYSPCPNDTFAFHAMVHSLVDCEGLTFDVNLMDIETLNKSSAEGVYDICKLSYHAYCHLADKYIMLRAGSALGFNNGPLLVAKKGYPLFPEKGAIDMEQLSRSVTAIPGEKTTAALLLKIFFPEIKKTEPLVFSEIEDAVLTGRYSSGVLIHESRFTYSEKGLCKIADLGDLWHKRYSLPIPLGGIAIRRSIDSETQQRVNRILKRSIEFAFKNPHLSVEYSRIHAREMEINVLQKHIKLFVNQYSVDISEEGERAVETLYRSASEIFPLSYTKESLFIL
ncbi:MAG: 1,4-dihydroxy-6-naphthoate synthase [Bacteroidetes bacterium HGW-Bacteroidetes-8]|jgi:1,4-dihydroxy-6-naphthoate synthase|nr:MAG: 1,4-dihydroxy-6-naphthoate synthase [Bacteroidetes bacterium HGW-Bacteroidetes-8]